MVAALETAAEIFKKVITEGPAALWEWIKDKVGDLKSMVIEQLQSFIITRVITAGITWLIGLLNPASAYVKACKAIYDIIMFLVERGSQILALVNAIIDSITAIASGAIGGVAAMVENALAKGIPVVIGFLAALLGLGGIRDKIKSVIETIRKPINAAIDWVITKAVSLVKAAGKFVGGLFGKGDKEKEKEHTQDLGDAKNAAREALLTRIAGETTLESARSVVQDVRHQLEPIGLKDLEIGPQEDDGSFPILAAASLRQRIARLAGAGVSQGFGPGNAAGSAFERRANASATPPGPGTAAGGGARNQLRPVRPQTHGRFCRYGTDRDAAGSDPTGMGSREEGRPALIGDDNRTGTGRYSSRSGVMEYRQPDRKKIGPREYDSKVTHCRASIHRMAMGYTPIVAAESIEY